MIRIAGFYYADIRVAYSGKVASESFIRFDCYKLLNFQLHGFFHKYLFGTGDENAVLKMARKILF